jgi:uncharacterized protein (TIGR03437 family)
MASLAALALLTLAATFTPVRAETYTALLTLSPLNENPPITNSTASGLFLVTIEVTRDANGNITATKMNYLGGVQGFPAGTVVTGLHIHEGVATVNGPVRFDSGLSGSNSQTLATGAGVIVRDVTPNPDPVILARLLANPSGFYLNLHTTVSPGGAIRSQLTKLTESIATTVTMNTAQEVPAPSGEEGTAQGTLTFNPTRNAQGQITGGSVTFSLVYDFGNTPTPITFTGLHIHEGPAGVAAGVVINTGLSGANSITTNNTKGVINLVAPVNTAASIGALTRLLANPAGFYVNIHTNRNPGGVIRAQLTAPLAQPLFIAASNKYFLPTGNADTTLTLVALGSSLPDLLLGSVLINGQPVQVVPDLNTGTATVTVPASLLANPGILAVQLRTPAGVLSKPLLIPVAAQASVNTQAATTTDAARFGTTVAPESIASVFGTKLSANTVLATVTPLPVALDGGTSVYVNGVLSPLFFVSPNQINYQIPEGTLSGPAAVVVRAGDGTISQGVVNVTNVAPGVFTRLATGLGAPSAVASTDGQTFNILTSNADGSAVELQAGYFVSLFGTGLRFVSVNTTVSPVTPNATISACGGTINPMFVGAQGTLVGVDQVNFQIPQSCAGKGDIDVFVTADGRNSNTVKMKVK